MENKIKMQTQLLELARLMIESAQEITSLYRLDYDHERTNILNAENSVELIFTHEALGQAITLSISTEGVVVTMITNQNQSNPIFIHKYLKSINFSGTSCFNKKLNVQLPIRDMVLSVFKCHDSYFANELHLILTGEKWADMEFDWGDYK